VLEALRRDKGFIDFKLIWPCRPVTLKVLLVVDGSISFSPGVDFGLSDVIDTLRDPVYSYVRFDITMATRQGATLEDATPGPYDPRYHGFRFDRTEGDGSPTIDKYHQLWLYGINSGNNLTPTNTELQVLTRWMNAGGGLFATGDHDTLGEAMCKNIPRASTMRKWTVADGVPSGAGPTRTDTNRPATPGQANIAGGNPDQIPFDNQSDSVPQPLELRLYPLPWSSFQFPFKKQPHPIMCDPQRGPIDVFPDHPHEGWVRQDNDVDLSATYDFGGGVSGDHYPTPPASTRPTPQVVAWANTLGDPPFNHAKGETPAKRFGVVGVYDGQAAGVGRVVVDSTWHHWFNINFPGLKADATSDHWESIQTFFRNVGIWMATAAQRASMLSSVCWNHIFTVRAFQELNPKLKVWVLGESAKDVIGQRASACVVHQTICDLIPLICDPVFEIERIQEIDDLCLTCPPFELLENAVFGGAIRRLLPLRDKVLDQRLAGEAVTLTEAEVTKEFQDGMAEGAREVFEALGVTLDQAPKIKGMFAGLANARPTIFAATRR
jgi:hypothetical protein